MPKKPKREVNWDRVEQVMRRSVTGSRTAMDDDLILCQLALAEDPERYRATHHRIYTEEVDLLRRAIRR